MKAQKKHKQKGKDKVFNGIRNSGDIGLVSCAVLSWSLAAKILPRPHIRKRSSKRRSWHSSRPKSREQDGHRRQFRPPSNVSFIPLSQLSPPGLVLASGLPNPHSANFILCFSLHSYFLVRFFLFSLSAMSGKISSLTKPLKSAITGTQQIFFGPFNVTPHVFYLSTHCFAIVNLKPLLPGHVLVSPRRVVPRMLDLTPAETTDFWETVRRVSRTVERAFKADALNVAVQDGPAAGQSVPHLHCHIIPRHAKDLDLQGGNDVLYKKLNNQEGDIASHWIQFSKIRDAGAKNFETVDDSLRIPRTVEEMEQEAQWLHGEMMKDVTKGASL